MPRVGYALPMQGFRPRTNPAAALGRLGLRGLGASPSIPTDSVQVFTALWFSPGTQRYYDSMGDDITDNACAMSQAASGIPKPSGTGCTGSDPGYVPGAVNADPSIAAEQANPDSCSLWQYWTDGCASVNRAQIQSVPINAAKYYGPNSTTAQVAQQVATQQQAQVGSDVGNVQQFYSTGAGAMAGNFMGLPWWAWLIGGVVLWKELK